MGMGLDSLRKTRANGRIASESLHGETRVGRVPVMGDRSRISNRWLMCFAGLVRADLRHAHEDIRYRDPLDVEARTVNLAIIPRQHNNNHFLYSRPENLSCNNGPEGASVRRGRP